MTAYRWNLWDDLEHFDLGESKARPAVWRGRKALYLEQTGEAILLRKEIPFQSYRLSVEVAIPGDVGFAGLVFGARDFHNYELVYLAPEEIQYDPAMNHSMTWQIYNGPHYQVPLAVPLGEWLKLSVEAHPDGAYVYFGEGTEPQLILSSLQHGRLAGRIGVWGYLPCYIRNLCVEKIETKCVDGLVDRKHLTEQTYITDWLVSEPFEVGEKPLPDQIQNGAKAVVEENGTLNLNRLYTAKYGMSVLAMSDFSLEDGTQSELSFGFSDHLRLWINGEEVYHGSWKWNPPASDGRIRPDLVRLPVHWKAGLNTIRALITNDEHFGWGLSMRTGVRLISPVVAENPT